MHLKTAKVKNPKNVLIQIPCFIVEKWNLHAGDGIEVHINDDEQSITILPRKGFAQVCKGSRSNEASEELVRDSIRY